jgi:hypothetical protein
LKNSERKSLPSCLKHLVLSSWGCITAPAGGTH